MTPRNGFATSSEEELFMRHGGHATADESHDSEEPKEVSVTQLETPKDGRKEKTGKVVRKASNRRLHVIDELRTGDDAAWEMNWRDCREKRCEECREENI